SYLSRRWRAGYRRDGRRKLIPWWRLDVSSPRTGPSTALWLKLHATKQVGKTLVCAQVIKFRSDFQLHHLLIPPLISLLEPRERPILISERGGGQSQVVRRNVLAPGSFL